MAELGMIAPRGSRKIQDLVAVIQESEDQSIPALARAALQPLVHQMQTLDGQINLLDREIMAWHKTNETSRRLATIPGIGWHRQVALRSSRGFSRRWGRTQRVSEPASSAYGLNQSANAPNAHHAL